MKTIDPVLDGHFGRLFAPKPSYVQMITRRFGFAIAALAIAAMVPTAASSAKRPHDGYLVARKAIAAPAAFQGLCRQHSWLCSTSGTASLASPAEIALAKRINSEVNRRIRQVTDAKQYGRSDHWALPTRRGGDCEDFALLKKKILVSAGVHPEALLVATVLDRKRKPHAVLVMRTTEGDLVLDNLTNSVKGWSKTGYSFLKMQNPQHPAQWDAIFAGGIFGAKA